MSELFDIRAMRSEDLDPADADALFARPYNQAGGFAVGTVLRRASGGLDAAVHAKAQADTDANIGVGLCLVVYAFGGNFSVIHANNCHVVNVPAHGLGAFGTRVYLSENTAGALDVEANVTVGRRVYLGFIVDADHVQWEPFARVEAMGEALTLSPRAEPPDPPADGSVVGWLSDGTEAYYDAGDIIFKNRQGGVTKSFRIIAYETV